MKNQKAPESKTGRRAFLRGASVVIPAALAPAAAGASYGDARQGSEKLGLLEDAAAIRKLHRDYAAHLAGRASEDLVGLFTGDGEALVNGRRFTGAEGLRRLCGGQSGPSGAEAVQLRLLQDPAQPPESLTVSPDGQSATAQFRCMVETATPLVGDASLLEMARLQGQHSHTWWEDGVYALDCVKAGESWRIRRLTYNRAGRRDGAEATVARFPAPAVPC
jgi:hypothetical protein